jgi:hypothetical protein
MKFDFQNFSRFFMIVGFVIFGAAFAVQAQPRLIPPSKAAKSSNIVYKERNVRVQISPTDSDSRSGVVSVSGTGQLRLSGTLTTGNGCCVRVKATIFRIATAAPTGSSNTSNITDGSSNTIILSETSSNTPVFKEQTFELCGSQQINLIQTINADQDDARFIARIQNIDDWNKTTVSGNLTLRYPTADRILTGQPSLKFDLPQGLEANRAFTLSPNTPGKLKVKVVFNGSTRVRVTLKKPNGSNARQPVEGVSGLEFVYDIAASDITSGATWTVNVLNLTNTPADDVDVSVIYTVDQ